MRLSVRRGGVAFLAAAPVALWLSVWNIEEARFSPFTLEYQKRTSLVVFTGEVLLYRGDWKPASNEVLNYISQKKYVEPIPAGDPQWKLVHRFKQGHNGGWERPFRSLHPKLVKWSEAHPDVAMLFWQTGYALMRSESEQEIDAGCELLGRLWEQCQTPNDLRLLVGLLELAYQIDVMSKAPSALGAVKSDPSKSAMFAPREPPKGLPPPSKKPGKKKGGNARPAKTPASVNPTTLKTPPTKP